jgi:hypothetical protein
MKRKGLTFGIIVLFVGMSIVPVSGSLSLEKHVLINFQLYKNGLRDDTTPPVTTIYFNPEAPNGDNGWYVSNVTIMLNATDDLSGVNITYYRVNNGGWEIYEYPFVFNKSNYYVIDYYSIDNAGNVESVKSASCKVDVVPPVTTVYIYGVWGENGWLKKFDYIEFKATDDMSGVAAIYCRIDGGCWTVYTGPFTFGCDGGHILWFFSVDRAGNTEDVKEVIIKLDGIPPEVTLTVKKIWINMWKFTAEAFDWCSGVDKFEFYLDGEFLGNVTTPGPYEWIWTGGGNLTVQAIAYDLAGNSAASEVVNSIPQSQSHHQPTFQYMNHYIRNLILRHQTTS